MLASLANIFRIPDLRKKVVFTLTIIALYQFGANVPVPFVNFSKVQQLEAASKSSGVLGFLNLFSGGALTRMAVFGLGIMPYITSSIIIQLLATVIPKLRGFTNPFRIDYTPVNLGALQALEGDTIDVAALVANGLARKNDLVKVLGGGELTRAIRVEAHAFSRSAEAAITAAGGSVTVVPLPFGHDRPPAQGNALTNR